MTYAELDAKPVLNVSEVARLKGVSAPTVEGWFLDGLVYHDVTRPGARKRTRLVERKKLDEWWNKRERCNYPFEKGRAA